MARFPKWFLQHLCLIWFLFTSTCGSEDIYSSATFTLKAKGSRLENYVIKATQTDSEIECGHLCLSEYPLCKSINYEVKDAMCSGSRHKCQLNNATKSLEIKHFVKDKAFNYFEMIQEQSDVDENNAVEEHISQEPFTANFTNLNATGRLGPTSLGSFYADQDHEKMVTLASGIQHWTVPFTGTYRITAVGASGGYDNTGPGARGRGAYMRGDFELTKGEVIKILVGQQGIENKAGFSSGGGGGTFVVTSRDVPLIVAGGGGGIERLGTRLGRCDASTGTSGNQNDCVSGCHIWSGGVNGSGGLEAGDKDSGGGGGGGFKSSGRSSEGGEGGKGFLQGGVGGRPYVNNGGGGFGGGGAYGNKGEGGGGGGGGAYRNRRRRRRRRGGGGGGYGNRNGAGGGGGYSGGASGDNYISSCGGGGGSYNVGKKQVNTTGYQANGHGFVEINRLI